MAIVTPTIWQAWANQTLTGDDLGSLGMLCNQVDAAIKSKLKRTIEQATYTSQILDAPTGSELSLLRWAPINVSGFSLSVNAGAYGDASLFTSDHLQTLYTDYVIDVGPDTTASGSGIVRSLTGWGAWGTGRYRPPYCLATMRVPSRGSIKVTFTGGYAAVPADIVEAACLAVSKTRSLRKLGSGVQSESWNGESYSLASGAFTNGVLRDPVIADLLQNYMNYAAMIG